MADETFELTRRKALAGLGTIGAASAGAGLGTTAYLNDTETFSGNSLQAGTLNLIVTCNVVDYDFGGASTAEVVAGDNSVPFDTSDGTGVSIDGDEGISIQLADVKPGDSFVLKKCVEIEGNPAYVRTVAPQEGDGAPYDGDDSTLTEPEGDTADSPDTDIGEEDGGISDGSNTSQDGIPGFGELDNAMNVTIGSGYDSSTGEIKSPDSTLSGSLNQHLNDLSDGEGIDFRDGDGNLLEIGPENSPQCVYVKYELPTSVGNVIQGDSVSWSQSFQAVQVRHNDSDPFSGF